MDDSDGKNPWKKIPKGIRGILRDAGVAFAIVSSILLILWGLLGVWPPMVVVETGSMEHSDDTSYVGVIDTGDMVFIEEVTYRSDITTYVEGRATGYERFGDYGDVVVYRKNGGMTATPVIHRTMLWIEYDEATGNFACPGLAGLTEGTDYEFSNGGTFEESNGAYLTIFRVQRRPPFRVHHHG